MSKAAATTAGAMSAVKDPSQLQDLLNTWNQELHTDVVVANHNSPVQAVISGSTEDITKIEPKVHRRRRCITKTGCCYSISFQNRRRKLCLNLNPS